MISQIKKFLTQTKIELKKVSWPNKNELVGSTVVVIITVLFLSAYIGIVDFVVSKLVSLLIK
jgi:preprotein translocase subunit SecE